MLFLVISDPRPEPPSSVTAQRKRYWDWIAPLQESGEVRSFEEVLEMQNLRDDRDSTRPVGPLKPAPDAVHVITDGLTALQVVDHLEAIVRSRMK